MDDFMTENMTKSGKKIVFRYDLVPDDVTKLTQIAYETGYFIDAEVAIVNELIKLSLSNHESGYLWVVAEISSQPVGFAAFGHIPGSAHSWNLYWLVVDKKLKGEGIGKALLQIVESKSFNSNCKILIAETSGRELYTDTHAFYKRRGYILEATIKGFYTPTDDKLFFIKRI